MTCAVDMMSAVLSPSPFPFIHSPLFFLSSFFMDKKLVGTSKSLTHSPPPPQPIQPDQCEQRQDHNVNPTVSLSVLIVYSQGPERSEVLLTWDSMAARGVESCACWMQGMWTHSSMVTLPNPVQLHATKTMRMCLSEGQIMTGFVTICEEGLTLMWVTD